MINNITSLYFNDRFEVNLRTNLLAKISSLKEQLDVALVHFFSQSYWIYK